MNTPGVTHVTFVSDKIPDNYYAVTIITEELRAKNAARVAEVVASVTANQPTTIAKATLTSAEVQGALIQATNVTREAVKSFGWSKVQADPRAPVMDLLEVRPDISGAVLPLAGGVEERCTINIPWSAIFGASLPDQNGLRARIAFQLTDALKSDYAACIQSSLPANSKPPNLIILNHKQFVSFMFESVDDAFVFAETVNEFRSLHD